MLQKKGWISKCEGINQIIIQLPLKILSGFNSGKQLEAKTAMRG